ncbi:MAG: hypothetical protein Q7K44_01620 [Candidatus Liptonbacteria bacterium]|nr:hypothetical protein [Candidatus Liptonbacteria bacterium]
MTIKTSKIKKHELVVLLLWPIIAVVISLSLGAKIYLSMLLFYGLPAIYLSYKNPQHIKKTLLFSLASAIPFAFLFDYVMEITRGWAIGRMEFPHIWFLQYVSFIQIIWLILFIYLIVIYYETFFEKEKTKIIYPKTKWFLGLMLAIFSFVVLSHFFVPSLLVIDYFYAKAGIVFVLLPVIAFLLEFPSLYGKFLKTASFFLYYNIIYEITALQLDQWSYPAKNQFIGYITLFKYNFPFEEFFFWIMIGSLAALSYYEFFDDDEK